MHRLKFLLLKIFGLITFVYIIFDAGRYAILDNMQFFTLFFVFLAPIFFSFLFIFHKYLLASQKAAFCGFIVLTILLGVSINGLGYINNNFGEQKLTSRVTDIQERVFLKSFFVTDKSFIEVLGWREGSPLEDILEYSIKAPNFSTVDIKSHRLKVDTMKGFFGYDWVTSASFVAK